MPVDEARFRTNLGQRSPKLDDVVYILYFIGFLSTDYNAVLLISKQIWFNIVTVISRWNDDLKETDEPDLIKLFTLHAIGYTIYFILTAVLAYFAIFPSKLVYN